MSIESTDRLDELEPCPFCGAGETYIKTNDFWTGMRNKIISAEVIHHCKDKPFQNLLQVRAKTIDDAIYKWNTRHHNG